MLPTPDELVEAMRRLRDRWQVELAAAVVYDQAERLPDFRWSPRTALVFGNEYHGLRDPWLSACDRLVTIPSRPASTPSTSASRRAASSTS